MPVYLLWKTEASQSARRNAGNQTNYIGSTKSNQLQHDATLLSVPTSGKLLAPIQATGLPFLH